MEAKRSTRLSQTAASQLAKDLIGPLGYARRRNGVFEVGELRSLCDDRVAGSSNKSFKEAFNNAGLFWN